MQTLVLCQEDFKEEAYWVALCDSLGVPLCEGIEEITIDIARVQYIEPH